MTIVGSSDLSSIVLRIASSQWVNHMSLKRKRIRQVATATHVDDVVNVKELGFAKSLCHMLVLLYGPCTNHSSTRILYERRR